MIEHWWLSPEVRGPLEERAPLDVSAWMHAAESGRVLSSDRQSVSVRIGGEPPFFVKWRRTRRGRKRRTFLRPSRERKEARAYLRMSVRGIRAPFPWAVGERRRGGVLVGSVLVRVYRIRARHIPHADQPFLEDTLRRARATRARLIDLGLDEQAATLEEIFAGL